MNVGTAIESIRERRFPALDEGPARMAFRQVTEFYQQGTNLVSAFLGPASMLALVFGLWRLSADLGWAGQFVISAGLFSHWQVWIALAIVIRFTGTLMRPPVPAAEESQPASHRRDAA